MSIDTLQLLTALEYLSDSLMVRKFDKRSPIELRNDTCNERGAIHFIWLGLPQKKRIFVAKSLRARNNRNRVVLKDYLKWGAA